MVVGSAVEKGKELIAASPAAVAGEFDGYLPAFGRWCSIMVFGIAGPRVPFRGP